MKLFASLGISLALLGLACTSVDARSNPHSNRTHTKAVDVSFRLQISGSPEPGTTFWVAYGPLGGRFGLLELRPSGPNSFAVSTSLPATGHTIFSYLAGHGVIHTRFGGAPGNPVVTIKQTGLVSPASMQSSVVRWQIPSG